MIFMVSFKIILFPFAQNSNEIIVKLTEILFGSRQMLTIIKFN
jgi:hypothetical protein